MLNLCNDQVGLLADRLFVQCWTCLTTRLGFLLIVCSFISAVAAESVWYCRHVTVTWSSVEASTRNESWGKTEWMYRRINQSQSRTCARLETWKMKFTRHDVVRLISIIIRNGGRVWMQRNWNLRDVINFCKEVEHLSQWKGSLGVWIRLGWPVWNTISEIAIEVYFYFSNWKIHQLIEWVFCQEDSEQFNRIFGCQSDGASRMSNQVDQRWNQVG